MSSRSFRMGTYRALAALMLPIVLQNLLSAVVNSADVFMLSYVGQDALSASSLANQITFVLTLFHWGLLTGTSILAAQYYGKKDFPVIRLVQGLSMDILMSVTALFTFSCLLVPQLLMRIFTRDPALIALGADFLRILGLSYLPMSASQVLLSVFKSVGQTKESAIISTSCLLCNITLNFVSIRILFPGQARLAMLGVAAATVIARFLELLLCALAIRKGFGAPLTAKDCLSVPRWLLRDYTSYTVPVLANNLIWGIAIAALTAIMGRLGSDMVSANAIASNLRDLSTVVCMALGTAGSILLGQEMGAGRMKEAKSLGRMLMLLSLLLGAAAGLLLMAARRPILLFSGLEDNAADLLMMMIPVNALYCIGRSYNSCLISGVFCAGGDTKFGVVLDTITMWMIVLPLSYIAAFVMKWPSLIVYIFLNLDEFVKMIPAALRFYRYRWLKNLTRDH